MQSALSFNNDATGNLTKHQAVTQKKKKTKTKMVYIKLSIRPKGSLTKYGKENICVVPKKKKQQQRYKSVWVWLPAHFSSTS